MPVTISKNRDGSYRVSTPNGVHSKHTTLAKAQAQKRIIDAADAGQPIVPKRKRKHA